MRFVDTNVLLYAVSVLPEDANKRRRARTLLTEADLAVSVQVLQEFYYQATRPSRSAPLTHADALLFMEPIMSFHVQAVTLEVFRAALSIRQRFGLSYWDSAILAAAELQCDAAGSHPVGGNSIGQAEGEPWRHSRLIQVGEMAEAVPGSVRAGRPRSQEAVIP